MVPMLDVLFSHLWELSCPGLLPNFRALAETELESRSGHTDFLVCWWKWDEVPFLLTFGGGVNSKVVLESGQGRAGLHHWVVLWGFILSWMSCGSSLWLRKSEALPT